MYKKFVPCLYFPTMTIVVDDELSFLESLCFEVGYDVVLKSFQNPQRALHFLQHEYQAPVRAENWILKPAAEPDFGDYVREFDIDIWKIHEEVYNMRRFEQIAVVVVDYAMPSMDGLTFFKELKESSFKRILLTGEADEKLAVEAFNQGLIHRFIRKDDPDYLTQLHEAIHDLEADYFRDISEIPLAHLKNNCRFRTCCLDNSCFIKFFDHFLMTHEITEYYLAGPTSSFMLLDKNGKPSWLVVKDSEQMQFYTEMVSETSSPFVRQALKSRNYVPYFYNHRDNFPAEWDNFLHPAKTIVGEVTNYYISYVPYPKAYFLDNVEKIFPYKSFLASAA